MIVIIILVLAYFNVLAIATRTDQHFQGVSSNTIINKQEYLEELYNADIVQSLNFLPTLIDKDDVDINENDIRLLSEECYSDERCLNDKKTSVKKYHQKMQAIQCIHGSFILKVLDELEEIICDEKSSNISQLKKLLRGLGTYFYLTNMMCLLHWAKWNAYDWQIEIFTFVSGLTNSDTNIKKYKERFRNYNVRMREDVVGFIGRCVHHKYLSCPGQKTSGEAPFSCLLDNAYSRMDLLYRISAFTTHRLFEHYSVRNLMLVHLYSNDDFIFDWSTSDVGLEAENVKSQLMEYGTSYRKLQSKHKWELDPIGGNKYNALIAKCIRLRIVYAAWFHLNAYHKLLSRPLDGDVREFMEKSLVQIWHTLVFPIKRALRTFGFDGNIYWSAIRVMMVDLTKISKQVLAAREEFTRNYFCRAVEHLGLARESDVNRKLQELVVANGEMYDRIKANGDMLDDYTDAILRALSPVDGTFIRIIVSAEGNKTFVTR
ncbi:uncharacterized protein LOC126841520 [Adelges cooleyi]|uniref:uncharacterized protein LOC126841520 n=1 Tax=Adelges cooleyi TaxID=133065 RepID=UPI00217F2B95|nr:uncharacterized protein LOC126841520 [Adelges cooleyi]